MKKRAETHGHANNSILHLFNVTPADQTTSLLIFLHGEPRQDHSSLLNTKLLGRSARRRLLDQPYYRCSVGHPYLQLDET
jgi:hypothetical protein